MTKRTPNRTSSTVNVKPKSSGSVRTEKSGQALLFAPSKLLECGLRDAHTHPLVGKRIESGVRSWRTSPARAWPWPMVEWTRTGNSYAAIGFDCDSREAIERAAASCMGGGDLPVPNVYATRTASGHSQVFYLLDRPVHRGEHARPKPLHYLSRVAEYFRASLGADAGYRGVLSSNPAHGDYQSSYPRGEPYALADLAAVIPSGWRVPRTATTGEGRNFQLHRALAKFAGSARHSDADVRAEADRLYGEIDQYRPHWFSRAELDGLVRSVLRKRQSWRSRPSGWHQPSFLVKQAVLGRRSGKARRAGTVLEANRAPWADLGISRATWYRRFHGVH